MNTRPPRDNEPLITRERCRLPFTVLPDGRLGIEPARKITAPPPTGNAAFDAWMLNHWKQLRDAGFLE